MQLQRQYKQRRLLIEIVSCAKQTDMPLNSGYQHLARMKSDIQPEVVLIALSSRMATTAVACSQAAHQHNRVYGAMFRYHNKAAEFKIPRAIPKPYVRFGWSIVGGWYQPVQRISDHAVRSQNLQRVRWYGCL